MKTRWETCRQLRHRRKSGIKPTGFGWQPLGRCEQYSHKYSTCSVAKHDHISSREHAWLRRLEGSGLHIFVSLKQWSSTCHVSFLAAPDADHKHKFSLTHSRLLLPYLSDSLTYTHKIYGSRPMFTPAMFHGSGGSTQIPSLTGYEPKSVEIKAIDTEAIEPEGLEPRRIELGRTLGTDPYQRQERFMRSPITEDVDEFGKVGAETSYLESQMHSDHDSAQSIADSDLWRWRLHHCMDKIERTVRHLEYQLHRRNLLAMITGEKSKCKTYSCWSLEKRELDVKFISRTESVWETRCNFSIKDHGTGKSTQEFFFQKRWSVKSGKISSCKRQRTFAQWSKIWTCETRTSSWISQWLCQWASTTSLCSKIGITGRTTRIY